MTKLKGKCHFCGKLIRNHSQKGAQLHLIMTTGYIAKLKQVQKHLTKDRKLMQEAINKGLSFRAEEELKSKLRYPFL